MPAFPTLCICRHQWIRAVRLGSTADTLIGLVSKGSALIGLLLLGFAFLVVLPEATGRVIVRNGLSAILSDYLFALGVVTLVLNTWLSRRGSADLFAYRFYPISLTKLAVVVQLGRVLHVRYVTIGAAVVITLLLVSQRVVISPLLVAGIFIVLLDVAAIWLPALHAKHMRTYYLIIITLLGVTLFDMLGGHHLSEYAFEEWMQSSEQLSFPLLILLGGTCAALLASHRRIRTLLRYGS